MNLSMMQKNTGCVYMKNIIQGNLHKTRFFMEGGGRIVSITAAILSLNNEGGRGGRF